MLSIPPHTMKTNLPYIHVEYGKSSEIVLSITHAFSISIIKWYVSFTPKKWQRYFGQTVLISSLYCFYRYAVRCIFSQEILILLKVQITQGSYFTPNTVSDSHIHCITNKTDGMEWQRTTNVVMVHNQLEKDLYENVLT